MAPRQLVRQVSHILDHQKVVDLYVVIHNLSMISLLVISSDTNNVRSCFKEDGGLTRQQNLGQMSFYYLYPDKSVLSEWLINFTG